MAIVWVVGNLLIILSLLCSVGTVLLAFRAAMALRAARARGFPLTLRLVATALVPGQAWQAGVPDEAVLALCRFRRNMWVALALPYLPLLAYQLARFLTS